MNHLVEQVLDVAIVGGGPAGLAAANRCLSAGVSFMMFEEGRPLDGRSTDREGDVGRGVGGSGLYSDGKLSFYPSGHALWALPGERILRESYGWLQNLAVDLVGPFPPFPSYLDFDGTIPGIQTEVPIRKEYKSLVLAPDHRTLLIQRLVAPIAHRIRADCRVASMELADGVFHLLVESADGNSVVRSSRLILSPGRFGARMLPRITPRPDAIFRRFEFGVRIQQPAATFFLKDDAAIDTKLILGDSTSGIEWRTFCCCRGGQIVQSRVDGLRTCSGTSCDSPAQSNIGFNCRLLSASLFDDLAEEVSTMLAGRTSSFVVPLAEFLEGTEQKPLYGTRLDSLLRKGITLLAQSYDLNGAELHGPCLEGTGLYPKLSAQLETSVPGLFVAGDSTGIFRGLVPALLSGVYAAAQASRRQLGDPSEIVAAAQIKRSPVATMPLVFTAQSKRFFYCRDVICEYVFLNGGLPINPFRVFDYFLSDRVDRDLVRRGNNQLIRSCDELWVFGPVADGVLFELFYAAHIGKPIRFFTLSGKTSDIRAVGSLEDISFEPEVHAPQQSRSALIGELRRLLDNSIGFRRERTLFDLQ